MNPNPTTLVHSPFHFRKVLEKFWQNSLEKAHTFKFESIVSQGVLINSLLVVWSHFNIII